MVLASVAKALNIQPLEATKVDWTTEVVKLGWFVEVEWSINEKFESFVSVLFLDEQTHYSVGVCTLLRLNYCIVPFHTIPTSMWEHIAKDSSLPRLISSYHPRERGWVWGYLASRFDDLRYGNNCKCSQLAGNGAGFILVLFSIQLLHSMSLLVRTVLFRGLSDAPSIATLFPGIQ